MAKEIRYIKRQRIEQEKELGFGTLLNEKQNRLINKDGTYNYVRRGLPLNQTFNIYHKLVETSTWRLFLYIFIWYSVINIIFVGLYYAVGIEGIDGMKHTTKLTEFWEVYFFSAQTFTTVGYGRVNPIGALVGAIASFEALSGLMSFALITGLLFARFSKAPKMILFSDKALIAPFIWNEKEVPAFMFRSANRLNTNLMNMKAQVSLRILENSESGEIKTKFYTLNLERETITFFPSNWTIVHPIDENSPLFGLSKDEIETAQPEFLVILNGFDETFDQNIFERTSYSHKDLVWGAKFVKIFDFNETGQGIVDLGKISIYEAKEVEHLISKQFAES